jgi:transcription elongation factor GreA
MSDEPVMLTKRGMAELQAELEELTTVRRAEVASAIRDAQELGPDQQDGQYEDAKNQQAFLEGRISEIERMLEHATLIDERAAHRSKDIRIGSTVTVKTKGGKSQKYQLVGPAEADPSAGRISHQSPVGRALLGKKRGQKVKIQAPGGELEMTVTSVS